MNQDPKFPTGVDPFLVQVVAVGVSHDLSSAVEEGKAGLRKRAGRVRENAGFPIIRGMSFALTNVLTRVQHDGDAATSTATLAAWYQLDFENKRMTPLAYRSVGQVSTQVIQEYDALKQTKTRPRSTPSSSSAPRASGGP